MCCGGLLRQASGRYVSRTVLIERSWLELATGDVVSSFLHARGEVPVFQAERRVVPGDERPRRRILSHLPALSQPSASSASVTHPVARALVDSGGAAVAALGFCGGRELRWLPFSWP